MISSFYTKLVSHIILIYRLSTPGQEFWV